MAPGREKENGVCKGPGAERLGDLGDRWTGGIVTAQSQGPYGAITARGRDQPGLCSPPAPFLALLQEASSKGAPCASIFSSAEWGCREPDLQGRPEGFVLVPAPCPAQTEARIRRARGLHVPPSLPL